jgi:signal transduction histidine kinase
MPRALPLFYWRCKRALPRLRVPAVGTPRPASNAAISGTRAISPWRAGKTIGLKVADNGTGVPTEQLPYLFDEFYRVHKRVHTGDTGMSLVISKGLIAAPGGGIAARNQPAGSDCDVPAATAGGSTTP